MLADQPTGAVPAPPVYDVGLGRVWNDGERASHPGPYVHLRPNKGLRITSEGIEPVIKYNGGLTTDNGIGINASIDEFSIENNVLTLHKGYGLQSGTAGLSLKLNDPRFAIDHNGLRLSNFDDFYEIKFDSSPALCPTGWLQPFPLPPIDINLWRTSGNSMQFFKNGTWQNELDCSTRGFTITEGTVLCFIDYIDDGAMVTFNRGEFIGEGSVGAPYRCRGYMYENTGISRMVAVTVSFTSCPLYDDDQNASKGWGIVLDIFNYRPNVYLYGNRIIRRARGLPGPTPDPFRDGSSSINPYPLLIYTHHSVTFNVLWPAGKWMVIRMDNRSGWHSQLSNMRVEFQFLV